MSTTTITMSTAPITEAPHISVTLHVPPAVQAPIQVTVQDSVEDVTGLLGRATIHAPAERANYQWILDDLLDIQEREQARHEELERLQGGREIPRDYLSARIYRVIHAAVGRFGGENLENEQEMTRMVLARVDALAEVLRDPLEDMLLQDAVMDSGSEWPWSLWKHRDCRVLFASQSPLDGSHMSEEPPPHLFARDMVVFVQRILRNLPQAPQAAATTSTTSMHTQPTVSSAVVLSASSLSSGVVALSRGPSLTQIMMPLINFPKHNAFRRSVYTKRCMLAQLKRQEQIRDDLTAYVNEQMDKIRQRSEEVIRDAREEGKRAEETIQNRMQQIDETHRNTITGLEGRIETQERFHQDRVNGLEAQIVLMGETETATANRLRQEVAAAQEANRNAVLALHNQIDTLTQTHADDAVRLQEQLEQTRRDQEAAVEAALQERQRVAALTNQVQAAQANLQATAQSLAVAQAQNAQNAASIQNLHHQIAESNRRLQEMATDRGHGFCSIS